jgi:hypothetical protein
MPVEAAYDRQYQALVLFQSIRLAQTQACRDEGVWLARSGKQEKACHDRKADHSAREYQPRSPRMGTE